MGIPAQAHWVTVPAHRISGWLDRFADRHGVLESSVGAAADLGGRQVLHVGAADGSQAWLVVPFEPIAADAARLLTTFTLHVQERRRVGVLIVRRGGHAAGIFVGAELVSSKVGSRYVQGQTKAGGWSQQRYQRRRDNQARVAFGAAADVAERILVTGPSEVAGLDALRFGGDRAAIVQVLADPRLASLAGLAQPALADGRAGDWLQAGDPKLAVLKSMPEQFLAIRIAIIEAVEAADPASH
jgi:hypothetical protein